MVNICPMISWYPIFPGGCIWDGDRPRLYEPPEGIRLDVVPARRAGEAVRADKPWESILHWTQVLRDRGRYRMWYSGLCPNRGPSAGRRLFCYAESEDGTVWRKPDLGLCEFAGSTANNILAYDIGEGAVFIDPAAAPSQRYRIAIFSAEGFQTDRTKNEKPDQACGSCIRGGHSADGIHWDFYPEPILNDGIPHDTHTIATYNAQRRKYVGYFRMFYAYRRAIGISETADFRHWPPTELCHQSLIADAPTDSIYTNCYTPYPDQPNVHLMFPAIYHQLEDFCDGQLMVSPDGKSWSRHAARPIVPAGAVSHGGFPEICVYPQPQLLRVREDNKFRMLVRSVCGHHNQVEDRGPTTFDWVEWDADRLGGLVADDHGRCTIMPLFAKKFLLANFRTEPDGWIRFELGPSIVWPPKDAPPKDGFAFADMPPMTGDRHHVPVRWKGREDLSEFTDQGHECAVAIRVRMYKATLYSVAMSDAQTLDV